MYGNDSFFWSSSARVLESSYNLERAMLLIVSAVWAAVGDMLLLDSITTRRRNDMTWEELRGASMHRMAASGYGKASTFHTSPQPPPNWDWSISVYSSTLELIFLPPLSIKARKTPCSYRMLYQKLSVSTGNRVIVHCPSTQSCSLDLRPDVWDWP